MKKDKLLPAITILLIILFSYTSITKLIDYDQFQRELSNQIFPTWLVSVLSPTLPLSELILTVCLLYSSTRLVALWLSFIFLFAFTGYIFLVLLNVFDRIPCSCGGVLKSMGFTQHLFFNIFFLILSAVGIYIQSQLNQKNAVTKTLNA